MFAVCANQKIRRVVWAKAHRSARIQVGFSRPCKTCCFTRGSGMFYCIKVRIQKLCKWKACKTKLLSWKKGWTDECRWIVDSTLFGYRKACWCSPSDVWKEAPQVSGLTSDRLARQMVDSWLLYVRAKERTKMFDITIS